MAPSDLYYFSYKVDNKVLYIQCHPHHGPTLPFWTICYVCSSRFEMLGICRRGFSEQTTKSSFAQLTLADSFRGTPFSSTSPTSTKETTQDESSSGRINELKS